MKKITLLIPILILATFLSSCSPKRSNKIEKKNEPADQKNNNPRTSRPSPTNVQKPKNGTVDNCSTANGIVPPNYTKSIIEDIHEVTILENGSSRGGQVWNSHEATQGQVLPNYQYLDEQLKEIDVKLKVRAIALESPTQNLHGVSCYLDRYTSLKFTVGLTRFENGNFTFSSEEIHFENVSLNQCSEIKQFTTIPQGSGKLVLYIRDIQSDFESSQSSDDSRAKYSNIIYHACWKMKLQFVTDFTKDFPNS